MHIKPREFSEARRPMSASRKTRTGSPVTGSPAATSQLTSSSSYSPPATNSTIKPTCPPDWGCPDGNVHPAAETEQKPPL